MRLVYYIVLIVSVFMIIFGDLMLSHHTSAPLPLADVTNFVCKTSSNRSERLNVQLPMRVDLDALSQQFCNSPILAQYFGYIRLSWKPRENISAADMLSEDYEVIMGRKNSLQGVLPDFSQRFEPLSTLARFPVYWYSFEPIDNLNSEALSRMKIGIVDDKLSHTHYFLPLRYLSSHSDDVDSLNIQYFNDTYTMYDAFKNQRIDLMSTGSWFDEELTKPFYKHFIAHTDVGGWFVSSNLPDDAKCELFTLLGPMTHHLSQFLQVERTIVPAECV
jgi:hypothetical protein